MKNWNPDEFNALVKKIQKYSLRNKDKEDNKMKGYRLWETMQIYNYIADVVLKGTVTSSAVIGWTKSTSHGPNSVNGETLEKYFKVSLTNKDEKGSNTMKTNYTDFTRQRVFEVHMAVCSYLDERGDEMAFWRMCDVIDVAKVAIPKIAYEAIQGFVDQYLEEDLFGAIYSQKERVDFDLKDMELKEVNCPNPECGPDHVEWFKLRNMYDNIAETYIRPILILE